MKTPNDCSDKYNLLDDHRLAQAEIDLPFVTVIVTNYNYENYVVPCLRSIARQKYPHFKCIVVDDVSTDHSVERIDNFIKSDESKGKFELICHENNGGQMKSFKTGMEQAEGDFVVFVDSDDIIFEDFLSAHILAHISMQTVAFTCSNAYQIDGKSTIIAGMQFDLKTKERYKYVSTLPIYRPFWPWSTTSSMMFRRSILDLIMPDDCDPFRVCADNYLCLFANLIGGSLLISEAYGVYRRHGKNNFANNPVISGNTVIGDMKNHPQHDVVRTNILSHFLEHAERFRPLLASEGNLILDRFTTTLFRMGKPSEIWKIRKDYPNCFPGKTRSFFLLRVFLAFLYKIRSDIHMIRNLGEYVS
jgi:glycosyltransferase involved in cell wall biosynthesis